MVLFLKIDCWGRLIGKKPIAIKLFDLCFWHWKTRSKCVKYFWNKLKLVRFIKPQTPKRKFNVNTNLDDWRSILFLLDFSSTSSFLISVGPLVGCFTWNTLLSSVGSILGFFVTGVVLENCGLSFCALTLAQLVSSVENCLWEESLRSCNSSLPMPLPAWDQQMEGTFRGKNKKNPAAGWICFFCFLLLS